MKIANVHQVVIGFMLSILFFVWSANYFWASIDAAWIGRAADLAWLLFLISVFMLSTSYRAVVLQIAPWLLLFGVILLTKCIFDMEHPYKLELYAKTLFYVNLATLAGVSLAVTISEEPVRTAFSKTTGYLFAGFVFLYLAYIASTGWRPGQLILNTDFGQYYQGISRLIAVAILVLASVRFLVGNLLVWICMPIGLVVIVSFLGAGALIGIALAFLWLIAAPLQSGRAAKITGIVAVIIVLGVFYIAATHLDVIGPILQFASRLTEKADVPFYDFESRPWLMIEGLNLWVDNTASFLFGPGLLRYSCHVGYFDDLRHPHNIVILLLVWFGVLSIPFMLMLVHTGRCARRLLQNADPTGNMMALLFFNYTAMAMIGGDLEQNRHLIFVAAASWVMGRSPITARRWVSRLGRV